MCVVLIGCSLVSGTAFAHQERCNDDGPHPIGVHHPDGIREQTTRDSLTGECFMKRMTRVIRKQFWFALGFVVMMTIMAAGPIFAADFDTEEDWLQYMREEEKLARDVYKELYKVWGLTIFSKIAGSEQKHMDAIKTLLDRYGLGDPAAGNDIGVFTNGELQSLYYALIAKGTNSVRDAIEVGLIIEETDIEDLEKALKIAIHKDVKRVYTNLMAGSYNHLAAFESKL
jgi:hypothetical protein